MSSSSRRTIDSDNITLREVYIRGASNTVIPTSATLLSDGLGGTRWVDLLSTILPSSLASTTTGLTTYINTFILAPWEKRERI